MSRRPHCRCTAVRNYRYEEAAEKLGCKPRFLQENRHRIPHQKIGEAVVFCECELSIAQSLFTVLPDEFLAQFPEFAPPSVKAQPPAAVTALAAIRPSQGRKKATASTG
ncbi:helix-turn-helix domain-containing protein [Streptomyces sp. TRM68367]|uniref:helix-turn-helix domain-containing protein n=1 Tax=Streptomyces sp. TRM68367 TaxID=2758415 RepID=UPI00165B60A7|nr:helix-turn-helix domain-containing protein [Streptomyces sp. TRM68367]MBC9729890.1 helix-turn-helix domain-containing protein [Streptomyces sp. TRM68367]